MTAPARIPERALWEALALYQGARYALPDTARPGQRLVTFPLPLPSVTVELAAPGKPPAPDCCTFLWGLASYAAQASGFPSLSSPAIYARAVASVGLWPTDAYVAAGLADEVVPEAIDAGMVPTWSVLQGWTRDPVVYPPGPGSTTSGHTMMLVDVVVDRCAVLHCGRLPGVPGAGGVGWREIGPLAAGPPAMDPPAGWWTTAPTWGSLRRTWPVMRAVALRVG